jgi:tRNA1Val (adenine37-N6)-methyltransferase
MSNQYFQFKQFIIHQDRCAMKVSTDSCLFGAWLSKTIIPSLPKIMHALDIGAGTGLLMLMMAQEHSFSIDGIELDEGAYQQASSNIEATSWKDQLQLFHGDVNDFEFSQQYDLIVSNPPFYEKDLMPLSSVKASAKHEATLNFEELIKLAAHHLKSVGYVAFLLPYHRFDHVRQLAINNGFSIHNVVHVRHQHDHDFIRSMILLGRKPVETIIESMIIKEEDRSYTAAFEGLLRDYYLHL